MDMKPPTKPCHIAARINFANKPNKAKTASFFGWIAIGQVYFREKVKQRQTPSFVRRMAIKPCHIAARVIFVKKLKKDETASFFGRKPPSRVIPHTHSL